MMRGARLLGLMKMLGAARVSTSKGWQVGTPSGKWLRQRNTVANRIPLSIYVISVLEEGLAGPTVMATYAVATSLSY